MVFDRIGGWLESAGVVSIVFDKIGEWLEAVKLAWFLIQ